MNACYYSNIAIHIFINKEEKKSLLFKSKTNYPEAKHKFMWVQKKFRKSCISNQFNDLIIFGIQTGITNVHL